MESSSELLCTTCEKREKCSLYQAILDTSVDYEEAQALDYLDDDVFLDMNCYDPRA